MSVFQIVAHGKTQQRKSDCMNGVHQKTFLSEKNLPQRCSNTRYFRSNRPIYTFGKLIVSESKDRLLKHKQFALKIIQC